MKLNRFLACVVLYLPVLVNGLYAQGVGSSSDISILFGGLISQEACGGGSSGPGSTTYTITVTGTSGSTQHSTTVLITVR